MALTQNWNRIILFCLIAGWMTTTYQAKAQTTMPIIELPNPLAKAGVDLNRVLHDRRSQREYSAAPLTLVELSQLLWSAQGISHPAGFRTAPSAGALYPLELFVVSARVEGLAAGIYHYQNKSHSLRLIAEGEHRQRLAKAALGQDVIEQAAAIIAITAVYARTARKYGSRAERYVHIEVGHVAQNIYLQTTALGLGTVLVGAFDDTHVQQALELEPDQAPLGLMPIGHLP